MMMMLMMMMMTMTTRQPIDISKLTPVFLDYNKVAIKREYKDVEKHHSHVYVPQESRDPFIQFKKFQSTISRWTANSQSMRLPAAGVCNAH